LVRQFGSATLARSGGALLGRHARRGGHSSSTLMRPLSGVSRPASPGDSGFGVTFNDFDDNGGGGGGGKNLAAIGGDGMPLRRPRQATPPTPLQGSPRGGVGTALSHTAQRTLGGGPFGFSGSGGGGLADGAASYHSGSADTLPSKARALIDRHSYYSAGVRANAGQRPRDYTVRSAYQPPTHMNK
jgi:hypothetical protein